MLKSILTIGLLYVLLCLLGYSTAAQNDPVKVREIVHNTSWAAVASISHNPKIIDWPMANVVAVDDSDVNGASTGHIRFLLNDRVLTGSDVLKRNNLTLFLAEVLGRMCVIEEIGTAHLACQRAIISGRAEKLDTKSSEYEAVLEKFNKRHNNAKKLVEEFDFYLNQLEIHNIFIMGFRGGPRLVDIEDYYNAQI